MQNGCCWLQLSFLCLTAAQVVKGFLDGASGIVKLPAAEPQAQPSKPPLEVQQSDEQSDDYDISVIKQTHVFAQHLCHWLAAVA